MFCYLWYGTEESFPLCGGGNRSPHLSGCPTALDQGRYRWRLDKVLMELAQTIEERTISHNDRGTEAETHIACLRAEEKKKVTVKRRTRSYMEGA